MTMIIFYARDQTVYHQNFAIQNVWASHTFDNANALEWCTSYTRNLAAPPHPQSRYWTNQFCRMNKRNHSCINELRTNRDSLANFNHKFDPKYLHRVAFVPCSVFTLWSHKLRMINNQIKWRYSSKDKIKVLFYLLIS